VRSIWLRHGLACLSRHLITLEKRIAVTGAILAEAQEVALKKKREDDVACDEIETTHPGYLDSQDTFYVGTTRAWGA